MAVVTSGFDMVRQPRELLFPRRSIILIVFCVALVVVFLRTPWPQSVLGDADQGIQLAGAQQIASGEHPFIDFGADYGPLVFYVSAVAQQLGGHSLGAEFISCTVGYAFAYALIFVGVSMVASRFPVTLALTLLAVIQLPRFYKYYILLGPALTLCSLMYYLARTTKWRLLLLAFSVGLTGLFRPDLGAYAVITAVVAIGLSHNSWHAVLGQTLCLGSLLIVLCSPWLVFLLVHHGLGTYFRDSILIAATHAQGLSNPFPRLRMSESLRSPQNLAALAYFIWWCMLPLAALVLAARWNQLGFLLRRRALITLLFSSLCLLQSAHRSDYGHLIQAIAPSYVLVAFTTDQLITLLNGNLLQRIVTATMLGLACLSVAAGLATRSIHGPATITFLNYYRFYCCNHEEFVRRLSMVAPDNSNLKLIRFIQSTTNSNDRVFLVSYLTQFYYLADRRAAGGQLFLAPGFFSADADEQRIIDTLIVQHNPLVIECRKGYDNLESRTFRSFEPKVFNYLNSAYQPSIDPDLPPGYVAWRKQEKNLNRGDAEAQRRKYKEFEPQMHTDEHR